MTDLTRKLATIVALDVAGFSARTEADEVRTIAQIANLRPVIEGIAKSHGGRVFNTAGDGFMLEFASSLSGVNAALELADECRPRVRVGVHVGEVSVQPNGDLLGHGVNVAARLMAKAEPGSAIISADVCRLIRGPLAERFVSRGPVQLDKMNETIEIYAPAAGTAHAAAAPPKSTPTVTSAFPWQQWLTPRNAAMVGAPVLLVALALSLWGWSRGTLPSSDATAASIAVLPFADMSSAQDQQYFSDGISEEVLNVLAQVKDLRVAGRTSSFAFKGQNKDLRQIGEILGVGYIVEGSIRKSGNKVRVTAQLIQAKDGYHQWSNTYDRDLSDIFTVQDEIAKAIVSEMSAAVPALAAASKTLKPSERAGDISAYDRFLLAREKMTMDGGRKAYGEAVKLLDEAIAADPHYAPALAWRSYAAQMLSNANGSVGTTPVKEALPVVKAFADRALAEDPGSAEGLFALAGYYGLLFNLGDTKQLDRAIETLRKAIAIRPNFSQAENDLALYLGWKGEQAESIKMIAGVLQRDPGLRDANVIYLSYLTGMGRFDEAEAGLAKWEKISPNQSSIKAMRVGVLAQRGQLAVAWRALEDLKHAGVDDNWLDRFRATICYALADGDCLLKADLPGRQRARGAWLKGDKKQAIELLATDPTATAPVAALTFYVPIHYAAGDIDGVVSYFEDKIGSPAAAIAARNACNCSLLSLLLALREAGHKDYKGILAAWKETFAERRAFSGKSANFRRELADVAALEGDFAAAKANYAAAMDAGGRNPLFLDETYLRFLPKDAGFEALRARMKSLINKERTALGLAPL
ncbi:MAG: adenylate/guanylate cyclase domain-containing protein [Micropepsaceae bacterium]